MQRQRARLGQRQGAQVLDQPREDARLVERRPKVLLVGGMDAVEHRLDLALDHRERRPELVADVRQQGPALSLVRLEARGHPVEGTHESPHRQRAPRPFPNAGAVVARFDAPGGLDEIAEWDGEPPDRPADEREPEQDDDAECREEGDAPGAPGGEAERTGGMPDEDEAAEGPNGENGSGEAAGAPHEAASHAGPRAIVGRGPRLPGGPPRRASLRPPATVPVPAWRRVAPGPGLPGLRSARHGRVGHVASSANRYPTP